MSADESRPQIRRGRLVEKKVLPAGPARDLRDAVYLLYAEADRPQLEVLARQIADDHGLPGAPGQDLIGKIVSGDGLASQKDTVTVAVALAQAAGHQGITPVAEQIRRLWIAAAMAQPAPPANRLGRPIIDCDPLVLEVHRPIELSDTGGVLPVLPAYVQRIHDDELRDAADQVVSGGSRLVTVVGGSSTGKTRACWELAQYLDRQQPGRWLLWHPYDPTRPQAALAEIDQVGPYTIVWLNEAQFYLASPDAWLGEQIAARLRTLIQDLKRGPVLVLATMWPPYWNELTFRPAAGEPDPYAQARDLLTGSRISVADEFTAGELDGLQNSGMDPRLRRAAAHAEGGRITQYLAGAPALEERYQTAPPAARAIIQVAMDARRLGHPPALPHALLEQAAPGYLDDHDWDHQDEDWLEQALAYVAQPCKGARGPLTRIRARPGEPLAIGGQPCYRLANYLDQVGRTLRVDVFPPNSLWIAFATTLSDPDLLGHLGRQAEQRGRFQHAVWQYTRAAAHGDTSALRELARLKERAGATGGAEALLLRAADHGTSNELWKLIRQRARAGDTTWADRLWRFGLTGSGEVATGLDFDPDTSPKRH